MPTRPEFPSELEARRTPLVGAYEHNVYANPWVQVRRQR